MPQIEPLSVQTAPVREPVPGGGRPDYADAFELRLPGPDARTAEEWARSALEQAPAVLRRIVVAVHRWVLGFRLDIRPSPQRVLGWEILSSEPEAIVLEARSWLLRGVIVGRRSAPTRTEVTTFVFFRSRPLARLVWAGVAPVHRTVARLLLVRAARGRAATTESR